MKPIVEFFFSPGSRYSYLAASQMPTLKAETGCAVEWRPVNGADIRALRGHDPFAGEPISGQYDWAYRERGAKPWADYYGVPFREPPTLSSMPSGRPHRSQARADVELHARRRIRMI